MRLLLVDDDEEFAAGLARFLARHDIETVLAGDANAARQALSTAEFDVVVLDVMLPGESGFDFLRHLRAMSNVPVIMLTALSEEDERVTGLDLGADDYVTKPFSAKELVSRLRAAHRRYQLGQSNEEFVLDDLQLMPRQYRARVGGVDVPLTAAECRILQLLLQARDRAVAREILYTEALFREESPLDRSLDVHMSNLRRKLGPHPTKGTRIKAIRGRGYTLTA